MTKSMPAEAKRPWNLLKNPGVFKVFMGNTKNKSLLEKYVITSMTWLISRILFKHYFE